jgi:hypothetical protein
MRAAMAAAATTADGGSALKGGAKPTNLLPLGGQGNACKSRLPSASGGANLSASPKEAPGWTTRHPATCQKHADCRPLLQQSSPNRGRVVQPGMSRKGIKSRLTLCA